MIDIFRRRARNSHWLGVYLLAVFVLGFALVSHPKPAYATAVNGYDNISFQGKVVNADGTNVTNGAYNFDFVLYDDTSLGTPSDGVHDKWHELTKSVTVTNGVFQTELGSATALPDFNANPALYLAIKFNGDAAGYMSPRIHLDSVPYAKNAEHVDRATVTTLGIGDVNATAITIGNVTNSSILFKTKQIAAAFQVQNASANEILTIDTSATEANNFVRLGKTSTINGRLVFDNSTNAFAVTLVSGVTGASYGLTLPTTGPSTSQCLKTDTVTAAQLVFGACSVGGSSTLDGVLAATGDGTAQNNAAHPIIWNWDSVTTQRGLTLGGGTNAAITTGGVLAIGSANMSYAHGAAETGSLATITFQDVTSSAFTTVTNGLLISPTINTTAANTRTINGLSVAPTLTACGTTAGNCTYNSFETDMPALSQTTTNTFNLNGFNLASAGAISQTVAAGTINYAGLNIATPASTLNFAGSTILNDGLKITMGTHTQSTTGTGTANGIDISVGQLTATATGGTTNGISIAGGAIDGTSAAAGITNGLTVTTQSLINTIAVTQTVNGLNVSGAGTTLTNSTNGPNNVINYAGLNITTPTVTTVQAAATINSDGIKITQGTFNANMNPNGGTGVNGLNIIGGAIAAASVTTGTINDILLSTAALTSGTSGTNIINGLNLASAGAISQTVAAGTINYAGLNIATPASTLNFAGSTILNDGLKITMGTHTQSTTGTGTANGLDISVGTLTATAAGGTTNGIKITGGSILGSSTAAGTTNGITMTTAGLSLSTATTQTINGLSIASAGTTLTNSATGAGNIINYTGIKLTMPAVTPATASANIGVIGLDITGGTYTSSVINTSTVAVAQFTGMTFAGGSAAPATLNTIIATSPSLTLTTSANTVNIKTISINPAGMTLNNTGTPGAIVYDGIAIAAPTVTTGVSGAAISSNAIRVDMSGTYTASFANNSTSSVTGLNIASGLLSPANGITATESNIYLATGAQTLGTTGTANINALNLASAGAISVITVAGTVNWNGVALVMPTLSTAAVASEAINADGLKITTPTSFTQGAGSTVTANGIEIVAVGAAAGTLNGLKISAITPGAGTETGISIGSGWDTALKIDPGNPQINSNGGLLTNNSIINIASTNHSYMTLDNRDLTIGGHVNQTSIANIQNIFVYDTGGDRDGGRWTQDERAISSSWYNEAKAHIGAACVVGTDVRCGQSAFPDKVVLVVAGAAGANTLYIFDAKDNSLWMSFTQNAGATVAMGVNANNTMSSVTALNGNVYVGTNGSASTGAYEINFKTDRITRYNATDAEDYTGNIAARNTAQTTAYIAQGRTAMAIVSATVNDVSAQIVNGKTMFATANGNAAAANGGISLINETAQTVANFAALNTNYQSIFITADDNLYGLNSTLSQLDAWYGASSKTGNNNAVSTFYDETTSPALWVAAPTFNTGAPDALFVTNGTSDADGQSNTMYVGHNAGMSVIEEAVKNETGGAVKYYTGGTNGTISEEIYGDGRLVLPLAGTAAVNNTLLTAGDSDVSVKAVSFTGKGGTNITAASGVRGGARTFDGTNYLCTGTVANTCANNANVDFTTNNWSISFWVKTASVSKVLVNKQATPGTTAGYMIQIDASGKLTSTATDGTTAITAAASTKAINNSLWHFVTVVENRTISGSACNAAGNSCQLLQYIDGVAETASTANITQTGSMTNATQLAVMANSAGATPVVGSLDEFTVTARALTTSQIRFMYDVGNRALNNPNHAGSSAIRGTTVVADGANELNGSSVVKAIYANLGNGLVYIGTAGGVSVVGIDTDTLVDLYSTSITTKDDVNTNYDATNGNAVNTLSLSKGYGMGSLLGIGFNNATAGGIWVESSSAGLVDFFGNSYNPFGSSLVQTNLAVDRVFRVTNQISTRFDNFSIGSTAGATAGNSSMPQLLDILRVDSNGLTVTTPTADNGVTAMTVNNLSGNSIFSVRNMSTNFGSLATAGAFVQRNSYFGEEFNVGKLTACAPAGAAAAAAINAYARGDSGGQGTAGVCSSSANATINGGELNASISVGGTTTFGSCSFASPGVTTANGVERITATVVNTVSSKAVCAENLAGTTTTSNKIYTSTNLPVIAMKVRPSTLPAAVNTEFVVAGISNQDSASGAGNGLPATGAFFTTCSTYSATAPTGCSNTTWYGMVSSGSAIVGTAQTCTGTLSLTNFAYLRIEYRSATDVHFYADVNTADGINEVECGTGVTNTSIPTTAVTPWMEAANTAQIAANLVVALDVDYFRSWQDDNVPVPTDSPVTTPDGQDIQSTPPITPDSTPPDGTLTTNPTTGISASFFDFAAATADDAVFNHDVYVHGTLFADKIKANQIEGIDILTDKISSLQDQLAKEKVASSSSTTPSTSASQPPTPATSSTATSSSTTSVPGITSSASNINFDSLQAINLIVLAQIESKGGLIVQKDAQFNGKTLFQLLAEFNGPATFHDQVSFDTQPSFSSDAGGNTLIKKDTKKISIVFAKEYTQIPIVVASWSFADTKDSTGKVTDPAEDKQQRLLAGNFNYLVTNVTTKGFDIIINKTATEDLNLSWLAMSVKDAKIVTSTQQQ